MKKIIVTAAVGAIVNCVVGHVVGCVFRAAGMRCPCD
jgi:hypothetical protein